MDAVALLAGKRFVKLRVANEQADRYYYYFAYPQDVMSILGQPSLFTNDHYAKKIYNLTKSSMLLSRPNTEERVQLKVESGKQIEHQGYQDQLKSILKPQLEAIRDGFVSSGQLELVDGLGRLLPLAVIKGFYGVAAPQEKPGEVLSKTQIAHFFDRAGFSELPPVWQENYASLGFSTTPDQTLLFWVRMLFIEVFLNLYNADYLTTLAKNASAELLDHLEQQIKERITNPKNDGTLMSRFITMYQQHLA